MVLITGFALKVNFFSLHFGNVQKEKKTENVETDSIQQSRDYQMAIREKNGQ